MANSCKCVNMSSWADIFKIPARTCGPLGINDHADPNVTTCLGDTPGSLGLNDHGDPKWLMGCYPSREIPGSMVNVSEGVPLAVSLHAAAAKASTAVKDPKIWAAWSPPADYAVLYELLVANEGNKSHMYLDTKNKVTVGIGTYLPGIADARKLRFYNRESGKIATDAEKDTDYRAVVAAKPDVKKYPKGRPAGQYEQFTKLDMTPTDIGERWLSDVKQFQKQLPAYFSGFAGYPADARQALTDIAYQYGAKGASVNAARGKLKEYAEKGDWASAAGVCSGLEGQAERNRKRKELFEAAAKAAPYKKKDDPVNAQPKVPPK